MTPSTITVPVATGDIGETIEDFVLDRNSGDIEKNLGQVVENALDGSTVPVAVLIVLEAAAQIRRAYIFKAEDLTGDLNSAVEATRDAQIQSNFNVLSGAEDGAPLKFEVADVESVLKGKAYDVAGLTQTAEITGSTGYASLDALFTPARKTFTLAALLAKMEDLALSNALVMVFVNQAFPEVTLYVSPEEGVFAAAELTDVSAGAPLAQVNGVFISASEDANPKFGFESGAGF